MIENKLTKQELKQVITPILKLASFSEIISEISKIFHIETTSSQDIVVQTKYLITFRGYEVNITFLDDLGEGVAIVLSFKKKKMWWHVFKNQSRGIVEDLQEVCKEALYKLKFAEIKYSIQEKITEPPIGITYYFDSKAFNSGWKSGYHLSPLVIGEDSHHGKYFVSFLFNPNCYKRNGDEIVLKSNWCEHIEDVTAFLNMKATAIFESWSKTKL